MKTFLFALFTVITASASAGDVIHVDANQAATLLEDNKSVIVLDVRTSDEFEEGHIANAKNIDFQEDTFEGLVGKLDKSKPYLVHCAAGGRSTAALDIFDKLGFTKVHHLDGGIKAWIKAGKPVAK
ncbi:MAG: rhodanese-like domain-containing protein [Verrucomicrobiaceae bacterium]|nr:rhodanese-like domain-containing protein [Verrucomicrobiaceae bacterium]